MGTSDRPGITDLPDTPKELGSPETVASRLEAGFWLNTDRQPSEQLRAAQGETWEKSPFHRRSTEDLKIPELAVDDGSITAAAIKGTPHWKPGDPLSIREFSVPAKGWEREVGVNTPDYRNPDAKDTLKLQPGDRVIVGRQGSEDNPRRYAFIGEGDKLIDDDDEVMEPELPSGEEQLDLTDEGGSKRDKIAEAAAKPEMIENIESAAKEVTRLVNEWLKPTRPAGSYSATPERPVTHAQPPQGVDGAIALAPVVLWLLAHHGIRSGIDRFNEWKQSRGNQPDARD